MTRYLIEIPHGADKEACNRAIAVFLQSGSHFLANADWGCMDGVHTAWFLMDAENKNEAMMVIPPAFRHEAHIIQLHTFTINELDEMYLRHPQ
jgi:hypothetical protein